MTIAGEDVDVITCGCDVSYETGDRLCYKDGSLTFYEDCIVIVMTEELYEISLSKQEFDVFSFEDFPRSKKSLRLIRKILTEAIEIELFLAEKKMGRTGIIQTFCCKRDGTET